jgi:serine/threonine protein kinase
MHAAPGTRLGPYEIVKPLGAGGMGEVYEARDTRLDRSVAIKVLPAALAKDASARARFDREARSIAALSHPNICALHDIGDADGHGFLVMERLEGETMQARLERGPLDLEQVVEYGIAIADALDAAHSRGLIHRDLKPANVFITTRGIVKILDFGLAKSIHESDADMTRAVEEALTVAGTTLGTVAYMSPEQLRAEPLDVRTDLFSLGLVLYEMATGQRAFPGSTSAVVAAGILNQPPPPPRTLRPDLPERLEEAILKTLEKDLAVRCQSAAELRADLTRVKRGGSSGSLRAMPPHATAPASVSPPAMATAATTPPRRNPWRAVALALAFIVVIVVAYNWRSRNSSQPEALPDGHQQQVTTQPQQPPPPARAPEPTTSPGAVSPTGTPADDTATGAVPLNPIPDIPAIVGSAIETTVNDALAEALAGARGGARPRGARGVGPGNATLVKMLRSVPPETYDLVYAANDPAAMTRALQILAALSSAGWTNASMVEIAQPQAKFGIFAPKPTPGIVALTTWARRSGLEPDVRQVAALPRPRIVIGKQQP